MDAGVSTRKEHGCIVDMTEQLIIVNGNIISFLLTGRGPKGTYKHNLDKDFPYDDYSLADKEVMLSAYRLATKTVVRG